MKLLILLRPLNQVCTIFCHASFGMFHASIVHVVGVTQASFHQWILVNGSKGACSPRVKRLSPPSQTSESAGSRKPIDTSTKIKPFWGLKSLGNDPFRPRPPSPDSRGPRGAYRGLLQLQLLHLHRDELKCLVPPLAAHTWGFPVVRTGSGCSSPVQWLAPADTLDDQTLWEGSWSNVRSGRTTGGGTVNLSVVSIQKVSGRG